MISLFNRKLFFMVLTATAVEDRTIADLYDLRYEVEEAFINKDSFLAREQVIRFENICRHFQNKLNLNQRYSEAIGEMKLMVFKQKNILFVQKRLLEEVRRFILDVHYLS